MRHKRGFAFSKFKKISNKSFDCILILAIVFLIISFQAYLFFEEVKKDFLVSDTIYLAVPLFTSIVCFCTAKSYGFSDVFGKSIFALGIGIFFYFLGEVTYLYYEYTIEADPYPSFADLFYFLFYPFVVFHIHRNIQYFGEKVSKSTKILSGAIGIGIVGIFVFLTYSDFKNSLFSFYIGLFFIISTAVTMSFAIIGVKAFWQTVLSSSWLIITVSLLLFVVGDVWYYYLEINQLYSYKHPVNMFWIASFGFIVYAMLKHLRTM